MEIGEEVRGKKGREGKEGWVGAAKGEEMGQKAEGDDALHARRNTEDDAARAMGAAPIPRTCSLIDLASFVSASLVPFPFSPFTPCLID